MIFERLIVVVREGVVGRPEKDDMTFFWADGTPYKGPTISPSGYAKFDACEHKWGLYAISKIPQKQKPSAQLGVEAHGYCEDWLLRRKPPEHTPIGLRLLNSGALEHFPQPQTEGLAVEQVFAFAFAPTALDPPVVFWGFKDAELEAIVFDLKSTGDPRWAKTPDELRKDPQANIYAADNMLQTGWAEATCRWVYFSTKGKVWCEPREATLSFVHVYKQLCLFYPQALAMTRYRLDADVDVGTMPRNAAHCSEFGGCDYMDLCREHMGSGSVLRAKRHQRALAEQRAQAKEQDVSIDPLAAIKAKMAAAGKAVPTAGPAVPVNKPKTAPAAPPKAAPAAPPKTAPAAPARPTTAAAAPRTGRLAAAVQGVGVATKPAPARGVAPPDAPSATAEGDPDEGLAEGEEEAEEQEQEQEVETPPPPPPKRAPAAPAKTPPAQAAKAAPAKAPPAKAPPKPAPAPEPEAPPAQPGSYMLLIDVTVVSGLDVTPLSTVLAPCIEALEAEAGTPYRLIEYNKGPSLLAAEVAQRLGELEGAYSASSLLVDREVLELVARHASMVLKG